MHRKHLEYIASAAATVIPISQSERFNEAMKALSQLVIDREAQDAIRSDLDKAAAKVEAAA